MKRQNLVIVRAGDTSLHPGWLEGPGAEARTWDIIVNYFGNDPDKYRVGDVVRIDSKGPKWPALYELIRDHAELIGGYERVWLPDDDLRCACGDVNRLFEIFEREKLELAQPSLRPESYVSHMVTVHNPRFHLHYTNFIEVMAPCFTRDSLENTVADIQRWDERLGSRLCLVGVAGAGGWAGGDYRRCAGTSHASDRRGELCRAQGKRDQRLG